MSVKCDFIQGPLNREYVTRSYYCRACKVIHEYSVIGKVGIKVDAYTLQWKAKKDDMRNRHHKDMLQPLKDGKPNKEFIKTYGKLPFTKPITKAKNEKSTK